MPKFFQYFQKEDFDIDGDGTKNLVNLSQYSKVFSKIADDISFYTYYTVDNTDRLDNISQKIYGTPEYYWTFFLVNKELNNSWKNFRKDVNEFNDYLKRKYPDTAVTFTSGSDNISLLTSVTIGSDIGSGVGTVTGIYPSMNYITVTNNQNSTPAGLTITSGSNSVEISAAIPHYKAPHHKENADGEWVIAGTSTVSIEQYESDLNDLQFQIKVIRPQHILSVARQFEREMKRRRV